MELLFLGTSAGAPSASRNVQSCAVRLESGEYVVVDCGEGTQQQLLKASRGQPLPAEPHKSNSRHAFARRPRLRPARFDRLSGQRRDREGAASTDRGPRGSGGVPADGAHPVADGAQARLPRDGAGDPGGTGGGAYEGAALGVSVAGPPSGRARRRDPGSGQMMACSPWSASKWLCAHRGPFGARLHRLRRLPLPGGGRARLHRRAARRRRSRESRRRRAAHLPRPPRVLAQ